MKAEKLMESIITAAKEGRHMTVYLKGANHSVSDGERVLLVPVLYRKEFILIYYGDYGRNDDDYIASEGDRWNMVVLSS